MKYLSRMNRNDAITFLPLGGAGEIGMNLNLYGFAGKWIIVDCGITFAGKGELPGVNILMPDPLFIDENIENILGVFLTHAHEDHIGAVSYLLSEYDLPLYASPFTAEVILKKHESFRREFAWIRSMLNVNKVGGGDTITLNENFSVSFVNLTHSTPETNALLIKTPVGQVFHTADWKFDDDPLIGDVVDKRRLSEIGDEGVLVVVGDSTNALQEGRSGSEGALRSVLLEKLRSLKGRIIFSCFSSNIARIHTAMVVAHELGRHLVLGGRSLERMYDCAVASGYFDEFEPPLNVKEAKNIDPDKLLCIFTGSQGEPGAILSRLANRDYRYLNLSAGDTVIFSSREIPGNEKSIAALHNAFLAQGVHVLSADRENRELHTSGHPCQEELKEMYTLLRPRVLIPVHGEMRHLRAHAELGRAMGIPGCYEVLNGHPSLIFADGTVESLKPFTVGRLALDGSSVLEENTVALQERCTVAKEGVVVIVAFKKEGAKNQDLCVRVIGIDDPEEEDWKHLRLELLKSVAERGKNVIDKDALIRVARKYILSLAGKKPLIFFEKV